METTAAATDSNFVNNLFRFRRRSRHRRIPI